MKVFLAADHRGFKLAEELYLWLIENKVAVVNVGSSKLDPNDDYVDYAKHVAKKVSEEVEQDTRGIVICGSGVGVDMVANKFPGIRCGLGFSEQEIASARKDDDINVLALPADSVTIAEAKKIVKVFLETPFDHKDRHQRRLDKLSDIEEEIAE